MLTLEKIVELMNGKGDLQATVDYVNKNFISIDNVISIADNLTQGRENLSRQHGVLDLVEHIKEAVNGNT